MFDSKVIRSGASKGCVMLTWAAKSHVNTAPMSSGLAVMWLVRRAKITNKEEKGAGNEF